MNTRPTLSSLGLATGKKARMDRILFHHGLGNGTALFLPYDQGLEHGSRDFFANPPASDPRKLGADLVKVNFPHPEKATGVQPPYEGSFTSQQAVDAVVRSANRTLVLISGGSKSGDEAMLDKARQSMAVGATGLIFGRNVWQREHEESPRFVDSLRKILGEYPSEVA